MRYLTLGKPILRLHFLEVFQLSFNLSFGYLSHVHLFLKEIGQGVQHIASRVENLVTFVQRGNDYREITNEVRKQTLVAFLFLYFPFRCRNVMF